MNCARCEERLSDYLEESLAAEGMQEMELHFESCTACRDLRDDVATIMGWGKDYPVHTAPAWLPSRIVANTPQVVRLTWRDLLVGAWRGMTEPRFAMSLLTATIVLGWMSSVAGFTPNVGGFIRNPAAVYYGMEGVVQRAYGEVVRNYYRSPLVNQIQYQIHTRIEQLRENS
jgi:predicted anti-sigma-YlaC factor YlaD